jgi:hypothetical protein
MNDLRKRLEVFDSELYDGIIQLGESGWVWSEYFVFAQSAIFFIDSDIEDRADGLQSLINIGIPMEILDKIPVIVIMQLNLLGVRFRDLPDEFRHVASEFTIADLGNQRVINRMLPEIHQILNDLKVSLYICIWEHRYVLF